MKSDRVVLIGPVLPYRGGIAQHTTMLHRALAGKGCSLTISFSRQYPRWLFPGKGDKDASMAGHVEDGVEYLIDSVNPMTWEKAIRHILAFSPRLVIFPWWHVYWSFCFGWISRRLKRAGIEIVFLCHNSLDHEGATWKKVITDCVLRSADRLVAHTQADAASLSARFPGLPVRVYPMPFFDNFPDALGQLPRRGKLEVLFFGFVRPYKGLDLLLQAMESLRDTDVYLSVVGEFWRGENEALNYLESRKLSDRVEIVAQYLPDEVAAMYFSRCDVVVLPYRSASGSAVIPVAYRYGKPVIATRVGGLPDVVEDGRTGLLIEPNSAEVLASAISSVASGKVSFDRSCIAQMKHKMTWAGLAETILNDDDL